MSVCPVQSTPAGLRAPDRYGAAAWPLVCEKQRLPRKVFRRSIAGLSGSLSTLRRAGYPAPTQDSLPAVGQTLLDGLLPAGSQRKVSGVLLTSHPPFPSLLGAITSTEVSTGTRSATQRGPGLGVAILLSPETDPIGHSSSSPESASALFKFPRQPYSRKVDPGKPATQESGDRCQTGECMLSWEPRR